MQRQQHDGVEPGRLAAARRTCPTASRSTGRRCSPTDSPVSQRGAERGGEEAEEHERQAELAERDARPAAPTWPRRVDLDARAAAARARRAAMIASDSRPPSGKPMKTLARIGARGPSRVHFSSTPPEEKKNTSYGVIAAPNRAIGVVPVGRAALRRRARPGAVACVRAARPSPGRAARPRRRTRSAPGRPARRRSPSSRTSPATAPARRAAPTTGTSSR